MARPAHISDDLLERKEASEFLRRRGYRVAYTSLAKWATTGGGPVITYFNKKPLYRPTDLLAWAVARTTVKASTSDPGKPPSPTA